MRSELRSEAIRLRMLWLVGLLLFVGGCNSDAKQLANSGGATEGAEKASSPMPLREPAPELEAAGIKLVRDDKSGQISGVDCNGTEVDDALAEAIAVLSGCTKLTITKSTMTDAGWSSLAALRTLQQLDLRDCSVNNSQLKSAVTGMTELRALRLSGQNGLTSVDDDGLSVLSQCSKLKVLAADELFVSEDGLKHLANCPQMSELYVKGTLLSDSSMALLADMKNLRKLRLAKTKVGTAGLELLTALELEDLDVSECSGVVDGSMVAIGKMKTLKRLNLWRDVITDEGAVQLAGLTSLQWLNLDNTHVRDEGLDHLAQLTQLTFLHLGSTGVTDAGMSRLAPLVSLKDLKVTRTSVTEEGVALVVKAIPGVDVQLKYIEGQ